MVKLMVVCGLVVLLLVVIGSIEIGFVELLLGVIEDWVVGLLDLQWVMCDGEYVFFLGLLVCVYGGVFYVDEVNLLYDYLVDILFDVVVMGCVYVECDGIFYFYEVCFVLIGMMNLEEGELCLQLLDWFGLIVDVQVLCDIDVWVQVICWWMVYEVDLDVFVVCYVDVDVELVYWIVVVWVMVDDVVLGDNELWCIVVLCVVFDVDGMWVDLVVVWIVVVYVVWCGVCIVEEQDIQVVVELVLLYCCCCDLFDDYGIDCDQLDEVLVLVSVDLEFEFDLFGGGQLVNEFVL